MRTHALYDDGHLCKVNENLFRHANDTPDDFKWVGSAYIYIVVFGCIIIIILFTLECGTHTHTSRCRIAHYFGSLLIILDGLATYRRSSFVVGI